MSQTILMPEPIPAPAVAPSSDANPQQILFQAGLAYIVSACVNVAVRLRIPDLIGFSSKSVAQLALESGANEDYLYRVLRVLEMNQIVTRTQQPRHYALTAAGALLRREVEGSMAAAIEWIADPLHLSLYSELRESVEEGETTFDRVYGEPFFQWLSRAENRLEAAVFNNAMTSISQMCIPAFLEAYSFEPFTCVVDVGGGHGALLRSILEKHTALRGVVAEMPALVENARRAIAADGLAGRCEAVECDFFAAVPAGGDCYLMKHIVHDWADAQAKTLLDNIRAVIPPDGRLVLAEAVLDASAEPHPGKLLDIEMMAFVGGRERTQEEFRKLLAASGFTLRRVVHTRSLLALLEAVPA